ncbi:Fc.00g074340.m01.CDS01 [Cosmosporella sp. VM-42]
MRINTFMTAAALGLGAFAMAKHSGTGQPCGLKIAPCPKDQYCLPDSPRCTDLNRCRGTCTFKNTYPDCGGFRPNPPKCDPDSTCQDDPRLPGSCGMACDKAGICVPNDLPSCGGFTGAECPKGLYCYDKPDDGCDPNHGGADCGGICL